MFSHGWQNKPITFAVGSSLIFLAALTSLLPTIQDIVLFPYYLTSGSTYAEMKSEYEKINPEGCSVVYSSGLGWLDEKQAGSNYIRSSTSGVVLSERIKSEVFPSCIVAFIQEVNSNTEAPLNMELIADFGDRSTWTSKLKAIRLLNSPKGYSFKAYRQNFKL